MKKLYVVRGIGCWATDVWASTDYNVTMLENTVRTSWRSVGSTREVMCYNGFRRLTGITLKPGEYTEIEMRELS